MNYSKTLTTSGTEQDATCPFGAAGSPVEFASVPLSPLTDVGGEPDFAHPEDLEGFREVGFTAELEHALASYSQERPDLLCAHNVFHVKDHRRQSSRRLTRGLALCENRRMPRAQYVYAVRFGPYLKVGLSEDPKKRITQFGFAATKGNQPPDVRAYKAEPVFAVRADLTVERVVHAILAAHRICGEWYSAAALPWVDELLALERGIPLLRYQFSVDPPPKVPALPCECLEDYDECDCPLSGDWHVHPWEPCLAHPSAPTLP